MLYNQLEESTKIKDAFQRWKNYREQVTEFIIEQIEIGDQVTILGAGACNDIDLNQLLPYASKICLMDKNLKSIEQAIVQYQVPEKQVTSYDRNFWQVSAKRFEKKLKTASHISELLDVLKEETQRAMEIPLPEVTSDFTICIGLQSQLNATLASLFYLYREPYGRRERQHIQQMLSWMNVQAVKKLHNWIFAGSRRVIVGYEYMAFGTSEEEVKKRKRVQNFMHYGQMQEVQAMGISRVEGGYQAESDLAIRYKKGDLFFKKDACLLWNFLPEKEYLMQFYAMQN